MRIGVLTGGGDCPGLNAVIRAAVRKGESVYGHRFVGYRNGWRGVIEGEASPLDFDSTRGILPRGGTILGTSRTNPYRRDDGLELVRAGMDAHQVDALIAIGGEDTLGVAKRLDDDGVRVVGVPKTIDNDLSGTDRTFGFETAVQIATDAIDRLHTTAESHDRVLIVEVMGRARGMDRAQLRGRGRRGRDPDSRARLLRRRRLRKAAQAGRRGRNFSIIVVAEGAKPEGGAELSGGQTDEFGHEQLSGIGSWLERQLGERTGYRVPHDGSRPCATRWHANRIRPRVGDPLRSRRRRRRRSRRVGAQWLPCGAPRSSRSRSPTPSASRRSSTPPTRRSSARCSAPDRSPEASGLELRGRPRAHSTSGAQARSVPPTSSTIRNSIAPIEPPRSSAIASRKRTRPITVKTRSCIGGEI